MLEGGKRVCEAAGQAGLGSAQEGDTSNPISSERYTVSPARHKFNEFGTTEEGYSMCKFISDHKQPAVAQDGRVSRGGYLPLDRPPRR